MTDLSATYDRLARRWTHEQLADHYHQAKRHGEELPECDQDHLIRRPIAILAAAVPACATLSVAIHVIHVMPADGDPGVVHQLFDNARRAARSLSTAVIRRSSLTADHTTTAQTSGYRPSTTPRRRSSRRQS